MWILFTLRVDKNAPSRVTGVIDDTKAKLVKGIWQPLLTLLVVTLVVIAFNTFR